MGMISGAPDGLLVVVPAWNEQDSVGSVVLEIQECLPGVAIVVVDDGSTDNTAQVAAAYSPRVRLLQKENGGLASARNAGARAVWSDLVIFLDADDRLTSDYIERTASTYAKSSGRHFVYTQWQEFGSSNLVSTCPAYDAVRLLKYNYIHASALVPREAVLTNPYYERIRLGLEDWDFYIGLHERGYVGVLVDEPLLLYRKHGASMLAGFMGRPGRARYVRFVIAVRHLRSFGVSRTLMELIQIIPDFSQSFVNPDRVRRLLLRMRRRMRSLRATFFRR